MGRDKCMRQKQTSGKSLPAQIAIRPAVKRQKASTSHAQHKDRVSCYACHSGGSYTNCYDCHSVKGRPQNLDFIWASIPKTKRPLPPCGLFPPFVTLLISAGIAMREFRCSCLIIGAAPFITSKNGPTSHTFVRRLSRGEKTFPDKRHAHQRRIKSK